MGVSGQPFDHRAAPTHWIFVDADDGRRLLDASCAKWAPPRPTRTRGGSAPDGAAVATAIPMTHARDSLVRLPEVKRRTGLARSTIYAWIEAGRFPRQVPMEGNIAVWRESDVEEWLASPR